MRFIHQHEQNENVNEETTTWEQRLAEVTTRLKDYEGLSNKIQPLTGTSIYEEALTQLDQIVNSCGGTPLLQVVTEWKQFKNKETKEIGTQTDLTAEQITQMEKDIEKYRDLLYQGAMEIDKIEKELTTLRSEIKTLQKQVKDKETNETEKELLDYVKRGISTPLSGTILPNELLEKLQDENKWTSLRFEYEIVRQKLITLTKRELERRDLATKITKLEKEKGELQTKYDMEVKSKKEVVEELDIARKYFCLVFKENFYQREISEIDKKRIRKFCSNSYNKVIVFSLNKEENDFSFFNFAPKNFFIDCRKAPSSFKLKTIERIGEKKTFKITTDYLFGENYIFGWDKVSVKEISREKMTRPEYWDADKYFDVVEYEIKKE